VLVGVVRGAQAPLLEKTIKEKLDHEHKVLNGEAERIPVVDEGLNDVVIIPEDDDNEQDEQEEVTIEPVKKQISVLVIKPDAVQAGKADEIIEKLTENGYTILRNEERQLTKEEAAEFYKQHETSEHFGELIEFMSSGPCMTLVLSKGDTGEGVIEELREYMGPPDVEQAKEKSPECLRAQYGTDKKQNALHASDSQETAARELAFFFPNYNIPWVPGTEPPIQRTVALIRPSALQEHKDAILAKIIEAGFQIAYSKELTLTKEQAAEFYKDQEDEDFYDSLCTHMSSGPVLALCLAKENAISSWREIIGPKKIEEAKEQNPECLRAQFTVDDVEFNSLHGSLDDSEAERDVKFFFPKENTVGIIKPNAISEKESIIKKIEESGFKVSLAKEQQLTKEMVSQIYYDRQNSDNFDELTDFMSSGPSLFMVLTREDALLGWRALIGPTDPEEAKQDNPDSLRALFGEDKLKNALHGSSDIEQAKKAISVVLGDEVEYNEDGTIKINELSPQEEENTNNQ
jgi:nucleoside diphosphate kinase